MFARSCPRETSPTFPGTNRLLKEVDGKTYGPDGEEVKRFGFHVLGRHSPATFLMDEGHNPR